MSAASAYDPAMWEGFAIGVVGAAAALAGLLVVGVVLLTPGQNQRFVGLEVAAAGVLAAGAALVVRRTQPSTSDYRGYSASAIVLALVCAGIFIVGGIGCTFGVLGGLYWVVPGTIFAFVVGLVNAWVDLVEILR